MTPDFPWRQFWQLASPTSPTQSPRARQQCGLLQSLLEINTAMTTPHPLRLVRLKEVIQRCGLGKTAIYTRIRAGEFPRPVDLGGVVAWVETEVDAWIEARIAARGLPQ